MDRNPLRYILPAIVLLLFTCRSVSGSPQTSASANSAADRPPLLKVTTSGSKIYVGPILKNAKTSVKLFDIITNTEIVIDKSQVSEVVNPLPIDDAIRLVGLPRLLSWQIKLYAKKLEHIGKVAKVTSPTVYVTLGKKSGVSVGTVLSVYRNNGEIKDPTTGEVLGSERALVSKLEITEVNDTYSKAKISSDLEIPIEVGDEVESKMDLVVAVCPIRNQDGQLSSVGASMSEEIGSSLVQSEVRVVERARMDNVLAELLVQNTVLFEPESARKLGELTGANYVVTGQIVSNRGVGKAFVRLVNVQTGEVALAATVSVNLRNATTIEPGMVELTITESSEPDSAEPDSPAPSRAERSAPASRSSSSARTGSGRLTAKRLPNFLTTTELLSEGNNGGVLIGNHGSIVTRNTGYASRNFTYEVLVDSSIGEGVSNIGMGSQSNVLRIGLHALEQGNKEGEVWVNNELIGHITSAGVNRVTFVKEGSTVTIHVDVGDDGVTEDDLEVTVHDLKSYVSGLHDKNSPLFVSGGGEFISISIK